MKARKKPLDFAESIYMSQRSLYKKERSMQLLKVDDIWRCAQILVIIPDSVVKNLSQYEVERQKFLIFCAQLTKPDGLLTQKVEM